MIQATFYVCDFSRTIPALILSKIVDFSLVSFAFHGAVVSASRHSLPEVTALQNLTFIHHILVNIDHE